MKKVALTSLIVTMLLAGCGDNENSSDNTKNKDSVSTESKNTLVDDQSKQDKDGQTKATTDQDNSKSDQQNKDQEDKSKASDQNESQSKTNDSKNNNNTEGQSKNSIQVVTNPTAISVIVNKSNALPNGYRPNDLVRPKVKFVFGEQKIDKALMRSEAASALEKMFNQASSQGIQLYAASGFRSYETQEYLFNQEIKQVGRKKAELAVAKPGTSEHQTGLTMDISAPSVNYTLTENLEAKKEGKWLAEHAHEFGFILRYPKGKEDITKYQFEPWHFRYVGIKAATEIYNKGITLEEYIDGKQGI